MTLLPRAVYSFPITALVIASAALFPPIDIQIGDHVVYGDRLFGLLVTIALGLWARPQMLRPIMLAAAACCVMIAAPRGFQWPSYSPADWLLCAVVFLAVVQLGASQSAVAARNGTLVAAALWAFDSLLAAPYCGALIHFQFTSATSACGEAFGSAAPVPAYVATALWVAVTVPWSGNGNGDVREAGRG